MDESSKEILKYESLESGSKILKLNEEYISLKQSTKRFQVKYDLLDTDIAICSRDVLSRFTEDFDYNSLYDDFINSLQASEINSEKIIAFELESTTYFARVTDPRTYAAITQDIISRYAYPMVLDLKLLSPKIDYTF